MESQLPHVRDCIFVFTKRLISIQANYRNFGGKFNLRQALSSLKEFHSSIPPQKFACDVEPLNPEFIPVSIQPKLLRGLNFEEDSLLSQKYRQDDRFPVMKMSPIFKEPQISDERIAPPIPVFHRS